MKNWWNKQNEEIKFLVVIVTFVVCFVSFCFFAYFVVTTKIADSPQIERKK